MQNLDSPQFIKLERQVDILIKSIQQLKHENNLLRQQVTKNLYERSQLIEKNKNAQERLTSLIARLKTESTT